MTTTVSRQELGCSLIGYLHYMQRNTTNFHSLALSLHDMQRNKNNFHRLAHGLHDMQRNKINFHSLAKDLHDMQQNKIISTVQPRVYLICSKIRIISTA